MGRCIQVRLSDGTTIMANVNNGVEELPQSDIEALELFIATVKAQNAKKKKAVKLPPKPEGGSSA